MRLPWSHQAEKFREVRGGSPSKLREFRQCLTDGQSHPGPHLKGDSQPLSPSLTQACFNLVKESLFLTSFLFSHHTHTLNTVVLHTHTHTHHQNTPLHTIPPDIPPSTCIPTAHIDTAVPRLTNSTTHSPPLTRFHCMHPTIHTRPANEHSTTCTISHTYTAVLNTHNIHIHAPTKTTCLHTIPLHTYTTLHIHLTTHIST